MDIATLKEITEALERSDIDRLEIDGPGIHLVLKRSGVAAPAAAPVVPTVIAAPVVDIPTARAPLAGQARALVAMGDAVAAGQVVGLVRCGLLLMPAVAPVSGTVLALPAANGATVGYGDALVQIQA